MGTWENIGFQSENCLIFGYIKIIVVPFKKKQKNKQKQSEEQAYTLNQFMTFLIATRWNFVSAEGNVWHFQFLTLSCQFM